MLVYAHLVPQRDVAGDGGGGEYDLRHALCCGIVVRFREESCPLRRSHLALHAHARHPDGCTAVGVTLNDDRLVSHSAYVDMTRMSIPARCIMHACLHTCGKDNSHPTLWAVPQLGPGRLQSHLLALRLVTVASPTQTVTRSCLRGGSRSPAMADGRHTLRSYLRCLV